jgi:hypothetical protein
VIKQAKGGQGRWGGVFETCKEYVVRAYFMLLVGTTIFSNKAKNYVDLMYLKYFREIDRVENYAWGTTALTLLY